ncbi:hypothetical protein H6789_02090 [Candidatus Nomurabacteria bacterium]|nr:hypothetical protein [Candidatus Nomurabacteria bacterium]
MNQLRKNIMRRVYYAYALRCIKHPVVSHSAVFVIVFVMFTKVVSVPDVWRNMMEIKVGEVLGFLTSALLNTDSLTWFLLGLMFVTLVSMFWKTVTDHNEALYTDEGGWALR